MRWCFIVMVFTVSCSPSTKDSAIQLNGMMLGSPRSDYLQEFHYYTGDEEFYSNYPTIRESLLNNIALGIREGVYEGEKLLTFGDWQAQGMTVVFYHEQLHKVQWSFKAYQGADVLAIALSLNQKFKNTYGEGKIEEYPEFTIRIWEGPSFRLQMFQEGDLELTVEFRSAQELDTLQESASGQD